MTQLEVRPLSRAVGAEILGINLLEPVSDAQIAEIRKIWLQNSVVFFREQPLEPGAFQAFAQRFGEIIEYNNINYPFKIETNTRINYLDITIKDDDENIYDNN